MKHFNTAGPMSEDIHYMIEPLRRWDIDDIMSFIHQRKYIILHAPRQTGKTTGILALRDKLNAEGNYFALYVNVHTGQAYRNDVNNAMGAIVSQLIQEMKQTFPPGFDIWAAREYFDKSKENDGISTMLYYLSEMAKKPVVLFIDEIDALVGDTLVSVLTQIRSGYKDRPKRFPSTVVLCGVRDIHEYRITTSKDEVITGGSCFNVKAESLRLGNFTRAEVEELYTQHTRETGQKFGEGCTDYVWELTDGQPWLVNALAYEVTFKMKPNRDRSVEITVDMIKDGKEELILRRQTHLDQLADKLKEDRVKRVILPMILGERSEPVKDDISYCVDLGLIKKANGVYTIANKIYAEILPRELTYESQAMDFIPMKPVWINPDGSICEETLLMQFKDFWNKNGGVWKNTLPGYLEAAPQLVLQAFLQKVVNGGGRVGREYALSSKKTDILVEWFYNVDGKRVIQNIVMEIKTIRHGETYKGVKEVALEQTAEYAKICGVESAHILIYDREGKQKWKGTEANEKAEFDGVKMEVWKMRK